MASFNMILLFLSTLMLQTLILEGDATNTFAGKSDSYIGKDVQTLIEHTPNYLKRYGLAGNLPVTRRRCMQVNEYVDMVRVHLHDIKYPWRWTSDPFDIPDVIMWGYFIREFMFYTERETANDTKFEEFEKLLEVHPIYKYLVNGLWLIPPYATIMYLCLLFAIPIIGGIPVRIALLIWGWLWNDTHRRFWRRFFLRMELGNRQFMREALPYSVDHHVLQYQYLIPYAFRETTEEGEPIEIVDFQGPVTLWIEDDSDSQLDRPNLMNLLYKGEEPRMELINMYHGVRISLQKQPEYRNENWYELENARVAGAEKRIEERRSPLTSEDDNSPGSSGSGSSIDSAEIRPRKRRGVKDRNSLQRKSVDSDESSYGGSISK